MDEEMEVFRYDENSERVFSINVSCRETVADGSEVISCCAAVSTGRGEVLSSEAVIEGAVRFCAVLKNSEGVFSSIIRTERFNYNAQLEGAEPRSFLILDGCARHVRAIVEAGSLMLSCEACVSATVVTPRETNIVTAVEGEDIEQKSSEITSQYIAARGGMRFNAEQDIALSMRLPEVKEVLSISANACVSDARCGEGQIIISGDISLQMFYSCEDDYEQLAQIADKTEFSQIIDVAGVTSDMNAIARVAVEDVNATVRIDEQGERRIINIEALLNANVYASEVNSVTAINDAFSTEYVLMTQAETIYPSTPRIAVSTNAMERLSVKLPSGKPPMSRICAVQLQPCVCGYSIASGRVKLTGEAEVSVVYAASVSGEIEGFCTSIPLSVMIDSMDIDEDEQISFCVTLQEIQALLIGSGEAEIRATFAVSINSSKEEMQSVLTSARRSEEKVGNQYGIIIYIVQQGDTLWSICKNMNIGVEDLKKHNPDVAEMPEVGSRIFIFKQLIP